MLPGRVCLLASVGCAAARGVTVIRFSPDSSTPQGPQLMHKDSTTIRSASNIVFMRTALQSPLSPRIPMRMPPRKLQRRDKHSAKGHMLSLKVSFPLYVAPNQSAYGLSIRVSSFDSGVSARRMASCTLRHDAYLSGSVHVGALLALTTHRNLIKADCVVVRARSVLPTVLYCSF